MPPSPEAPPPNAPNATTAPPAPAYLVDLRWGVAYPLHRVCTGLGRDASNPVIIRDTAASRSHCEIQRNGDGFALHPIGSAETHVNGSRVRGPCELKEGDLVEIAYSRFRFTRQPPQGDVLPAPEHPAVDSEFAARNTEVREIVTPERLQELRRQMLRPVELHWRVLVASVLAGALLLAILIRLAMRLL
jgi:hypothetical protein